MCSEHRHIFSNPASRLIGSQTAYIRNFNHSNISKVHLARGGLIGNQNPETATKGAALVKTPSAPLVARYGRVDHVYRQIKIPDLGLPWNRPNFFVQVNIGKMRTPSIDGPHPCKGNGVAAALFTHETSVMTLYDSRRTTRPGFYPYGQISDRMPKGTCAKKKGGIDRSRAN
ncbi:hypothetical protein GE21DRAFT_1134800 [Neurospora crassa]|nr:hypothetical protein GE21DRAFT_1134800 [Neurospora crassa]